jgi:hypothetical protein
MEDLPPTSADKGKARAVDEPNGSTGQSATQATPKANSDSLATRVIDSATGLARDLVGSGNGSLTSTLAASASASGKIVPSIPGRGAQQPSESLQSVQKNHVSSANGTVQDEAFRTSEVNSTVAEEYEQFQQSSNPFVENVSVKTNEAAPTQWANEFRQQSHDVQAYSQDDGLEVQLLLSDPYFVAMTDDAVPEPDQTAADADDLFGGSFSVEEQEAAKELKADLPPVPIHQPVAADNPRNLVANFENIIAGGDGHTGLVAIESGNVVHFHSEEQRKEWYSQWSGVLNQYTDEVWGDMLPLVREEQKHAEAIKEGKENLDSKSVQRLNMILGHVVYHRQHDFSKPFDLGDFEVSLLLKSFKFKNANSHHRSLKALNPLTMISTLTHFWPIHLQDRYHQIHKLNKTVI